MDQSSEVAAVMCAALDRQDAFMASWAGVVESGDDA
jgi:hypothetical protein